jgi:hypothetical protein
VAVTVDQPFSLIGAHVPLGILELHLAHFRATGPGLTVVMVWPYHAGMATQTIKTTYALDVETVRTLERVARRWGVSRSEALRRAIRVAARDTGPASDAIVALDALQRSLGLSATATRAWASRVRAERRASTRRRQTR